MSQKQEEENLRGKAARASDASDKAQASTYMGGFVLAANDAIDTDQGDWILDSGASRHLVNDKSLLIGSTA